MKTKSHAIEIIARGVCVDANRLLVCRGLRAGNLYLPGGHVEFGESAREALEREILEETGLVARAGRFLGAGENRFEQDGRRHAEINLVFEMQIDGLASSPAPPAREDWIRFEWLTLDALPVTPLLPPGLRDRLRDWLADARGPDRFVQG